MLTSFMDGPKELYAWDVRSDGGGQCGVSDDRSLAIKNVHEALRTAECGARGQVRRVGLSPVGFAKYVELGDVGEAWRDEETGAVVWRNA